MKVILRSSSLLFTLLGITANARVSKVETALRRGVAGRARIGMTREELLTEFGEAAAESGDGATIGLHFGSDHSEPASAPIKSPALEPDYAASRSHTS
jgi:hypothetical protein